MFFFARRTSVAALISDSLSACRAATDRYGVLTPFCIGGMFGAMFGAMFGDATKGETLKMEPSGGEAFAAAPSAVVGLLAAGRTGESWAAGKGGEDAMRFHACLASGGLRMVVHCSCAAGQSEGLGQRGSRRGGLKLLPHGH